ncbi:MAG: hypothetical protein H6685_06460 [Deltaproteobacteria bacterium]|nr:hypothetical protein [Deltaproteobacteria bacterium]
MRALPWIWMVLLMVALSLGGLVGCGGDDDDDDSAATSDDDDDDTSDDDTTDDDDTADDDTTDDDTADDDTADDDTADDDTVDDDDDDTEPVVVEESCPDGPAFPFDLTTTKKRIPFPSDLFTVADEKTLSGRRVNIDANTSEPFGSRADGMGLWVDAMNTLDGFGPMADLFIDVAEVEPRTKDLPETDDTKIGASVFLINADEDSPNQGQIMPMLSFLEDGGYMRFTPWEPLDQRTRYLVVVTRKLTPKGEDCYAASEDMMRLATEYANLPSATDEWEGTALLDDLGFLESQGLDFKDVLAISSFTTLSATKDLEEAVQIMDDLYDEGGADWSDWETFLKPDNYVGMHAFGMLEFPIFQTEKDKVWKRNVKGELKIDRMQKLKVLFSFPDEKASGYSQPFPLVIMGHGAQGSKNHLYSADSYLSEYGFAGVAMDFVCHGDRLPPDLEDLQQILCYFDAFHPLTWRDNIRESVANMHWLRLALQELATLDIYPMETNGDGIPDFDLDHIYYMGVSLGSIHGGVFSGVEKNIDAWWMNVAGGKYTSIALDGPIAGPIIDIIDSFSFLFPKLDLIGLIDVIAMYYQSILDAGDPANYVKHTVRDPLPVVESHVPQVLQQGSSEDDVLGGPSGGYYCRAGGWPQLTPFAWDVDAAHDTMPYYDSAFVQFDSDDHQLIERNSAQGAAMRKQGMHFLRSFLETGTGEIKDYLTP